MKYKINHTAMMSLLLIPLALFSGNEICNAQNSVQILEPIDVPDYALKRLKGIYADDEFAAKSFSADWLPDGSGYVRIERMPGKNGPSIVAYDAENGKKSELISSEQLILSDGTGSFNLESYLFSKDGSKLLLEAVVRESVSRKQYYWMYDIQSGKIEAVVGGRNNEISPDGNRILFSEEGNLYVYDITTKAKTQLTFDAVEEEIWYGNASWNEDGTTIAFVQTDASRVRIRSSLIPGDPTFPEVREERFARIGGIINSLQVGVVDAEGKEIRWLPLPVPKEGFYLGELSWTGNPNELLIEQRSRFREHREFFIADIGTGEMTIIYAESDLAWVVASYGTNGGLDWINNYQNFIVLTEKDGWRHAYLCSRDGNQEKLLTPGEYDVIDRVKVDESGGWFYYYASPENGTQSYLYRVRLDGKGKAELISPENQSGTHSYSFSPDAKWAFHTYSSSAIPPVTELVEFPKNKVKRVLEDNEALKKKMALLDPQPKEFIKLETSKGYEMDTWLIKPRDFDPSKKYPVFVYVYGEPHAQTVKDSWGNAYTDFHRVIADLGYLVVSIDNRGTPCPKGAAWRRAVAGSLGPLSTDEQAEGLEDLARTRPYVDLTRVGIWGWSGGGSNTLNAMFRKPDLYDVGIAVAPKPQPHLYNAWFQEIYMKTPEVNPEGYRLSAPINYAEGLKGNLLIIHGSGETNTHVQITEGLVDKLIELGKQFDYMSYPNRDHGIREGEGTSLHLRTHIVRYLLRNLPAGPR